MRREAILLYGAGETDANVAYATRFLTPDPYVFLQVGAHKTILIGDLELGRARQQATVHTVRSYRKLEERLKADGVKSPGTADVICAFLRRRRVRRVVVPANFPLGLADELRERRVRVVTRPGVFWPSRCVKTSEELRAIEEMQRAVEYAVGRAIEVLQRARIRGDRIIARGETVTSESLRRVINIALMERECVARNTIVACGDQACDPHQRGTGPLRPHRTIVMDVFPQSNRSHYFADMTRTVVKGKASPAVKRLYAAVCEAQDVGISRICPGVDGKDVHEDVQEAIKKLGYETKMRNGRMEGFFHGTGHGVGLDLHEAPWLTPRGGILEEGAVVTVEPGLYYFGVGAVRLEDMVVVTRNGSRNLTRFPKFLEV